MSRGTPKRNEKQTKTRAKKYPTVVSEKSGIKIIKRKEHHTSQECPSCGNRKKTKGRVYTCRCGYKCHRDLHGAGNILTEYLYGNFQVIKHKDHIYLRAS